MSDGIRTPEAAEGIQTPPTPVSAGGPVPKKTKGKPRAKAAASEKPTGLMAILWGIAVTAEQIDWSKVYVTAGYKSAKSAAESFRVAKKKYLESVEEGTAGKDDDNAATADDDSETPVKAKKRKVTKPVDQEAKPKKARKTKAEEPKVENIKAEGSEDEE
ncbi:MAG: hypothetical protein GOMPHAMPRED_004635 [Gomphillus americanus]|uniref:Uncharacterized protein n=1 Tax=Gomphillus americanus TaxID=1940652 RepID=A0A8H3FNF1_9LECA|nr:MAG: hypothetical protein GOMPHAMPRED_004635 [Gomphillus americanus]